MLTVGGHEFHRRILDNGLRAAAVRDTGRASVFVVVGAGKRHETPETSGLAHLTEHAMYAGSASAGPGEHDRQVKAMGAESNAYTREDYTLYYDHLFPAERLDEVLALEAGRLRGLTFPEDAVLHERDRLIHEEEKTWQPSDALRELVEAAVYRVHNYRAGVLDAEGRTAAKDLGIDAIRAFYDRYYHPNNAAVVVVSPLDPAAALDAIERAYGGLPRGPEIPAPAQEPPVAAPRRETLEYPLRRDRVEWTWIVPDAADPDRLPLTVLARLAKRETATDGAPMDAELAGRVDRDLFRLIATGEGAEVSLEAAWTRLREVPPPADALAEVKALLRDDYAKLPLRARPYFSLAGTVGVYEVLEAADELPAYAAAVDALTAEEIRDAARRHLAAEARVTVAVRGTADAAAPLPEGKKELADFAQEAEAAGDYDLAIEAYSKLLDGEPSTMYQVIYLASRGQIKMQMRDYDGAIDDFERALRIVDYPAVRELLDEATALRAGAALRRTDD